MRSSSFAEKFSDFIANRLSTTKLGIGAVVIGFSTLFFAKYVQVKHARKIAEEDFYKEAIFALRNYPGAVYLLGHPIAEKV